MAGKRAGLAGERSGLFMEQIRIVKEMREEDRRAGKPAYLIRPRFMVWENVPGAFSSNKGEDFRAVLEETIRIAEPDAPDIPLPPKGKWPLADCWMGAGWSVAYRVFDAQFWGTPQRRRRIALVADFGGHAAPEILFVRQGLSGDFDPCAETRKEDTAGAGGGAYPAVYENHGQDSRLTGPLDVAPTVAQKFGTGGNNTPLVVQYFQQNASGECRMYDVAGTLSTNGNASGRNAPLVMGFKYHQGAKANGMGIQEEVAPTLAADGGHPPAVLVMATGQANAEIGVDICPTLNCNHEAPVVMDGCLTPWDAQAIRIYGKDGVWPTMYAAAGKSGLQRQAVFVDSYVRRLTPLECERLQGYPDGWTDIGPWTDSAGKVHKESSDSARYRALGNSIALPSWRLVIKRLCGCYERDATMASLFDGIGGFPLIWERLNGPGSCLWASEIEEFPIAVTKARFDGKARW